MDPHEPPVVVLHLAIEPGPSDELVAGTIGADGDPPVSFHGWMELMVVISEARAAPH